MGLLTAGPAHLIEIEPIFSLSVKKRFAPFDAKVHFGPYSDGL
jgi:hypothetical protein